MTKSDLHPWASGMAVAVIDRGREVYRAEVVHLTATQVVTQTPAGAQDRWRRHDGSLIDPVYHFRTIRPAADDAT